VPAWIAILVGGRTLLDEDPKTDRQIPWLCGLNGKLPAWMRTPSKWGSSAWQISNWMAILWPPGPPHRLIYTTRRTLPGQIRRLENAGARVFTMGDQRVDCNAMLASLYDQGIRKGMVEGGGTLIAEFFRLDLVMS